VAEAPRHHDAMRAHVEGKKTRGQRLAAVRAILAAFDREHDDRQYALEAIERIVTGDGR